MCKRLPAAALIALVSLLLLTGCGATEARQPRPSAYITGATLSKEEAGQLIHFDVPAQEAGQSIGIEAHGTVAQGSLRVVLVDSAGQIAWQAQAGPGPFAINTVVKPEQAGRYQLGLAWDGAVTASYALAWQPGAIATTMVTPAALLGGLGMGLVAIAFVAYAARRRLGWRYLGLGAAAWVVTVACKFAWAYPANTPIYNALHGTLPASVAGSLFYVYVGALTGVFEVGLVWLLLRCTRLGRAGWGMALAFGIGFGAVEALLLGLGSLASIAAALANPSAIGPDVLASLAHQNSPLYSLAPVVERVAAMGVHVFANVLVFYAVRRRQLRWFWLAFIYKTAVDSVAAFAQLWGVSTLGRLWAVEAIVIVFGVIGFWGIRRVARAYRAAPAAPAEL